MYQNEEQNLEINIESKCRELILLCQEEKIVYRSFPQISIRQYELLNSKFLPHAPFSGIQSKISQSTQIHYAINRQKSIPSEEDNSFEMHKKYDTYKGCEQHQQPYSGHFNKNYSKSKSFKKNKYELISKQVTFDYKNVVVSLDELKLGPKFSNPNVEVQALQNFRRLYEYLTEVFAERLAIENEVMPKKNLQPNGGYIPQTGASNFAEHLEYTKICLAFELGQIQSVVLWSLMKDLYIEQSVIDICPNLIISLSQQAANLQSYEIGPTSGKEHLDSLNQILLNLIHEIRYLGVYLFSLKLIIDMKKSEHKNYRNIYIGSS